MTRCLDTAWISLGLGSLVSSPHPLSFLSHLLALSLGSITFSLGYRPTKAEHSRGQEWFVSVTPVPSTGPEMSRFDIC